MKKIILATTSPHRIASFKMLGIDFETCASKVDERYPGRPSEPRKLVMELAWRKAQAVAKVKKVTKGIVIGFDSIGWFQNEILEKPKSKKEATRRLSAMSGGEFQFFTGICVIDLASGKKYRHVASTRAYMRKLSIVEIERYLDEDPNFSTYALGFDPLGHKSVAFISRIEGSYNNILRGIPLELICEMLKEV